MKKMILSAALFFAAYGVNAQGLYGDVSVGYGLGAPNYVMGTNEYRDFGDPSKNTEENIYGSIGQGLNLALTPGYMINEHFGLELGINYFMGAKKRVEEFNSSNDKVYSFRDAQSNQLRLIPSLVVSSGTSNKLSVYAKGGLMIPVLGVTNISIEGSSTTNFVTYTKSEVETEFKGKVSLGFRGALGVNYKLNDNMSLFGELQQTNLFIKQDKNTIVSYKVNGSDIMNTLTDEQKETVYVDKLDAGSAANKALAGKTNFNQFGFNVGLKWNF
ncbi:MAG: hypothetical protein E6Q37_06250 [Crocinitomicaceae bacterium]|nr:MAG: hypothetical protein E6Q37_06250 [Crocinitomicaceae bacterium]